MMALPSPASKLLPGVNYQDNHLEVMTTPCDLQLGDQFYFSNMLRSFLPKNRSCKKFPGYDPVTSLTYCWYGWRPGPQTSPPWPWGLWLPPCSSITAPCIFPSGTSGVGNKIFLRTRNKRTKLGANRKPHASSNGNFRPHGRSAFAPIRPGLNGRNCVGHSVGSFKAGSGPSVHYVVRNLSAIYNRVSQSAARVSTSAILASSLPSARNLRPDCGRFSALLGLELVVDYVTRDDVLAKIQNGGVGHDRVQFATNCQENTTIESSFKLQETQFIMPFP